jgi:hypothetical protein
MTKPQNKDPGLSDLGNAVERALKILIAPRNFAALAFGDQMTLIDRALKLEQIKQRSQSDEDGAWFREHNFTDDKDTPLPEEGNDEPGQHERH